MKKILVVAQFFPYPPQHGSAADIWGQLLSLNHLGYTIDLVATDSRLPGEDDLNAVRTKVRNISLLQRKRSLIQILSPRPFQVESRRKLRTLPLSDDYDFVVLQTEYVCDILRNKSLKAKRHILRVHNDENCYYSDLSRSSKKLAEKVFFLVDAIKFRFFTPSVWKQCSQLWFISDAERNKYIARYPRNADKAFFIPTRVDGLSMKSRMLHGTNVLFIGALNRPMNMQGLLWYLTEVHPHVDVSGYHLVIAGHTGGEPIDWLRELCNHHSNISTQTDVADLEPLYSDSAVFVNPIFAGAGLKLKTIHALEAGLPVVTTDVGAEGSGLRDGEHLLIANSADTFLQCVRTLLLKKETGSSLVRNSQGYLQEFYNQEKLMACCLDALSTHPEK